MAGPNGDGPAAGCIDARCLLDFEDFTEDRLGFDKDDVTESATLMSALPRASFLSGEVGLSFSAGGGMSSELAMDVRGVNNLDARGVDVLAADFVMVSEEPVLWRIGTIRTVAVDPSLGCEA